MLKINVKTIPHREHRFTTCGDWYEDENGVLQIRITDYKLAFPELSNKEAWMYEAGVFIHEIVEWLICEWMGVKTPECDDFDRKYEEMYTLKQIPKSQEAGYDKNCPYHRGHVAGDIASWLFCKVFFGFLSFSWKKYDYYCDKLCE
jgi:hypothetical protein